MSLVDRSSDGIGPMSVMRRISSATPEFNMVICVCLKVVQPVATLDSDETHPFSSDISALNHNPFHYIFYQFLALGQIFLATLHVV